MFWSQSLIPYRMAATAPKTPAGDDRNLVAIDENYLAPSFEDKLTIFWEKNARTVVALVIIVVLALLARWGFQLFAARREAAIRADYAAAASSDQLKAFIVANPAAPLSGVVGLRLADEAYVAGNFIAAREAYAAAAPLLGTDPLAFRARLGAAISPLQAGDVATARPALEALANDTAFAKALRAEAAYHLAVLARDAGQPVEATRWTEIVLAADSEGMWAQRALQLRGSFPVAPAPAPVAAPVANDAAAEAAATPAEAAVIFPATK